jgi:uncharacterized protein YoaH (UPF0181 family)
MSHSRREFLADVGKGMIAASIGAGLATDLGLCPAFGGEEAKDLSFGSLEPLVALLEETPKTKLMPILVEKLNAGLELKELTAAAAFANARLFGGENYFGFHTFMALVPAYSMAAELPKEKAALPLLKVLYRNAHYAQEVGGRKNEVLKTMTPADSATAEDVHKATNAGDRANAEKLLAACAKTPEDALNAVLLGVEDNHDVHTAVMPWRAYAMLDIVGKEHAITMLRQSVRQCAKQCESMKGHMKELEANRAIVPNMLEKYHLPTSEAGAKKADDMWVEKMCGTILTSSQQQAAEAVAMALAEGLSAQHIGEAISLAANQLVLRQVENWEGRGTPLTQRTHGDSPGVHASDATNAWRNMVRVSNPRNRAAGLMLAAMDVARSSSFTQGNKASGYYKEPLPHAEQMEKVKATNAAALLKELDGAIRENNQLGAAAIAHAYGQQKHAVRPMLDLLLQFAISEDGRLHAEKYYRTASEEYANTREAFRHRQLVALSRVTASMYGYSQQDKKEGRAPGYEEACKLLRV